MEFKMRSAKNGWILKDDEGNELVHADPVDTYGDHDEVEAFADFLYTIAEHYGPSTSRYSPKRIYIRIEPGDKYEPPGGVSEDPDGGDNCEF